MQKRVKFQAISVEYILCNVHNGLKNFIQKIEHNTIFESDGNIPDNYITVEENSICLVIFFFIEFGINNQSKTLFAFQKKI